MPAEKMHAEEVETDVSLVRRLLAGQFPHWADLPIAPVESAGTDNAIYRLGDDMAVRLPRIHWATGQVEKEQRWLPWLAPHLPVAIPVALAKGEPGEGYPWHWSVCTWLTGENPTADRLAEPSLLATDLAEFILALQRIDPTNGPRAGRGGHLARRDADTRTAIEALHGMVDTDAVAAVWDAALRVPEWSGTPVWLHSDLAPGNVLVVDGRLSAVIDFAGVGVGDPAGDLPVAWNLLPTDARNVFRAALGIDEAAWERGRGLSLSIALIQLPYYWSTNPVLAAGARHTIAEVLADHERTE